MTFRRKTSLRREPKILKTCAIIYGTKNQEFVIDRDCVKTAGKRNWWSQEDTKRKRWEARTRVEGKIISLPRFLMGLEPGDPRQVDHIDGNWKNNKLSNLRICTHKENMLNVGKRRDNTSGYLGVSWYSFTACWMACIRVNKRNKHLGYFSTAQEAAIARDKAAIKYRGKFARLNFPELLN